MLARLVVVALLLCLGDSVVMGLPDTVDWTTKGVVTPVVNQGDTACNFSWAFAATGGIEAAQAIDSGILVNLSEQELIDCASACGGPASAAQCSCAQLGCAFSFADSTGLCTEESYPYVARAGACGSGTCTTGVSSGKTNWTRVGPGSENALLVALTNGPIVARLAVGSHGVPLPSYLAYTGGIFSPAHYDSTVVQWVLIAGYTPTHFIVKNSLGSSWGESGYMELARGGNFLGVEDFAYAVTVTGGAVPVPAAPCDQSASTPTLSIGAVAGLSLVLCSLGIALLRKYVSA